MIDDQIRERCATVGLRWLPPDDGPDGFPGSFDMVSMAEMRALLSIPVDVVLHCPKCHTQHIDKPESDNEYSGRLHESSWWELGGEQPARWTNPPHRTHLCAVCKCLWRAADVPTNGIAAAQTRGERDTWPVKESK